MIYTGDGDLERARVGRGYIPIGTHIIIICIARIQTTTRHITGSAYFTQPIGGSRIIDTGNNNNNKRKRKKKRKKD